MNILTHIRMHTNDDEIKYYAYNLHQWRKLKAYNLQVHKYKLPLVHLVQRSFHRVYNVNQRNWH